jgi:hypothetical protein
MKRWAMANPIPRLAPVTTATAPLSFVIRSEPPTSQ